MCAAVRDPERSANVKAMGCEEVNFNVFEFEYEWVSELSVYSGEMDRLRCGCRPSSHLSRRHSSRVEPFMPEGHSMGSLHGEYFP